ncbi:hypothetical protein FCT18_04115 [Lysinibacillus sphaericus]|uniref:DUF3899 domain-containing protein n=1 Tax=Lysinibacillus sphaericus TaxID=1421 RepID=A0A2S0JY47_LYSSH|nr:hypothetical protein [Lysinibacillus sphaericus]AVK96016.1 hypothetical protein LS41612_07025 [Lysinibacillus sphaericus]MCS1384421.1 hypothetical protein [Lysinibacillus sphaericus]MED4544709.1 hypothetical protein [Lysinibacillus sphaericus]TKI20830.1 hypothetical protein FCT18_04115 [Lysinibacillus sphaericus]UDK97852.1 hypothetical protein EYB33_16730 [Lysinibacillus sphaericus]
MRKKDVLIMLVTLIVEGIITYLIASFFSVRFIEIMFFVGFAIAGGIFYFLSSGGPMARYNEVQVTAQTGIIHKNEQFTTKKGPIFLASVLFCLIGLVFFLLLIAEIIPPSTK